MKHGFNQLKDRRILAASAALMLGAVGCGGESGGENRPTREGTVRSEHSAPSGRTPEELASSIAQKSREYRGEETVPREFCENTNSNPQPMYSRRPARLIVNSLCQPPLGEPVGVYEKARFKKSELVGKVRDGDVVEAHCIEPDGEKTTNVTGPESASNTWVRISHGEITGSVSEVNFAYVNDSQLRKC